MDKINCPVCKSDNTRNDSTRANNGVIGPGYKSWVVEERYSCNECGVYWRPVEPVVNEPVQEAANTQLPADVLKEIKAKAEAAYLQLDSIVTDIDCNFGLPMFEKRLTPIEEAITEYAIKLHQEQQGRAHEVSLLKEVNNEALKLTEKAQRRLQSLQAKCERYEAALKMIASPNLYTPDTWEDIAQKMIQVATEALSGDGVKEESEQELFDKWVRENAAVLGESHWLVGAKHIHSKRDLIRVYNYLNQKEDKQ